MQMKKNSNYEKISDYFTLKSMEANYITTHSLGSYYKFMILLIQNIQLLSLILYQKILNLLEALASEANIGILISNSELFGLYFSYAFNSIILGLTFILIFQTRNKGALENLEFCTQKKISIFSIGKIFLIDLFSFPVAYISYSRILTCENNCQNYTKIFDILSLTIFFFGGLRILKSDFNPSLSLKNPVSRNGNNARVFAWKMEFLAIPVSIAFKKYEEEITVLFVILTLMKIYVAENSDEYIDIDLRKFEFLVLIFPFWVSLTILMEILFKRRLGYIPEIFLMSFLGIVLRIIFQKNKYFLEKLTKKIEDNENGNQASLMIERLIRLNHSKKYQKKLEKTLITGYLESQIRESKIVSEVELGSKNVKKLEDEEIQLLTGNLENEFDDDLQEEKNTFNRKLIIHLFMRSIKKLRISLSYYLLEFTRMKVELFQELEFLEKSKYNFSKEEKTKYFFLKEATKKKFKNFRGEMESGEENVDLITAVAKIRLNEAMDDLIEKATEENIRFWQFVEEDYLDIKKFSELLEEKISSQKKVEKFWNMNKIIDELDLKSKQNFGIFCKKIMRRNNIGDEILDSYFQKWNLKVKKDRKIEFLNHSNKLENNQSLVLILEKKDNGAIIIENCNKQTAKKFRFLKKNLVKEKFNKILLKKSQKYYRRLFRKKTLKMEESQESLCFKDSQGYIKILHGKIKLINLQGKKRMIILLEEEKKYRQKANFLVERSGRIIGRNSESLNFLPQDLNKGRSTDVFLSSVSQELAKQISEGKNDFFFKFEFGAKKFKGNRKTSGKSKKKFKATTQRMKDCNLICVRITEHQTTEKMMDNLNSRIDFSKISSNYDSENQNSKKGKFEFFVNKKLAFVGNFLQKKMNDQEERDLEFYEHLINDLDFKKTKTMTMRTDYAKDIRVKRLVNGFLRDINDFMDSEPDVEEESNIYQKKKIWIKNALNLGNKQNFEEDEKSYKFHDLKELDKILLKKKIPIPHKTSIIFSVLIFILTIIGKFINFSGHDYDFEVLKNIINHGKHFRMKTNTFIDIHKCVRQLTLLNQGINLAGKYGRTANISTQIEEEMQYLKIVFEELKTTESNLEKIILKTKTFIDIGDLDTIKNVNITVNNLKKEYNYHDSVNQLKSKIASVLSRPGKEATIKDKSIIYILKNSLAIESRRHRKESEIRQKLNDDTLLSAEKNYNLSLNILIGGTVFTSLVGYYFFKKILDRKEKVIEAYYGFRTDYAKKLTKESVEFLSMFRNGDVKDTINILMLRDKEKEKLENKFDKIEMKRFRKKKKKGRLTSLLNPLKILPLVFSCLVFSMYWAKNKNHLQLVKDSHDMVDSFDYIGMFYSSSNFNLEILQVFMENPFSMIGSLPTLAMAKIYEFAFYRDVGEVFWGKVLPYKGINQEFERKFGEIFEQNVCGLKEVTDPAFPSQFKPNCTKIFNGFLTQGMHSTLVHFMERMKKLNDRLFYLMMPYFPFYPFEGGCDRNLVIVAEKRSQYFHKCVLVSRENYELGLIQRYFVKPLLSSLSFLGAEVNLEKIGNYEKNNQIFLVLDIGASLVLFTVLVLGILWSGEKVFFFCNFKVNFLKESIRFNDLKELKRNKVLEEYLESMYKE